MKDLPKRLTQYNQELASRGLRPICRRGFLKIATSTAAGMLLPLSPSCGSEGSDTDDSRPDLKSGDQEDAAIGQTCPDCVTVGIAKENDIVRMVRTSIELTGGLDEIKGGDRVFIKPNISGPIPAICTNIEVVRGVIQAVKKFTDGKYITVAENSALGMNTEDIASGLGFIDLCEQEGVRFFVWESEEYQGFRDERWREITEEKLVPRSLKEMSYDHFINVPVLKNHEKSLLYEIDLTCCMKNFVGLLHYQGEGSRLSPAPFGIHNDKLGEQVAELGCIVPKTTMNVVDATTICLQNGPASLAEEDYYQAGLVLASQDRVACDAVSMAVLKHFGDQNNIDRPYVTNSVLKNSQIKRAIELGLGVADPDLIELVDSGVDEIDGIKEKLS